MSLPHALIGLLLDRPMTGYDLKLLFDKELNSFWPAQMSQIYRELGNIGSKGIVGFKSRSAGNPPLTARYIR